MYEAILQEQLKQSIRHEVLKITIFLNVVFVYFFIIMPAPTNEVPNNRSKYK
jgi:hypothetical protein